LATSVCACRHRERRAQHRRSRRVFCAACHQAFVPNRADAQYCSNACRTRSHRRRTAARMLAAGVLSSRSIGREIRTGDQPSRPDGPLLLRFGAQRRGQRGEVGLRRLCRTLSSHARRTRHRDGEAASRQKNLKLEAGTLIGRPQISSGWRIALPVFLLGASLERGSVAAPPSSGILLACAFKIFRADSVRSVLVGFVILRGS
jgi:hypothetical protein